MAGIYVHIPFCSQSCYYCDFHFSTSLKSKKRVLDAIVQDILRQKKYLKNNLIHTVYFGGGTPSLIESYYLAELFNTIKKTFSIAHNLEFTIEANPEDVTEKKVEEWSEIGINRISLGVQSFRESDLKYMNRVHTVNQAINAIKILQKSRISNLSIDLIYGFPKLSNSSWIENLKKIVILGVPHISCYCLTVERNTPLFFLIKKGAYRPLSTNRGEEHFLIARDFLKQHKYNHYEISNFSKPGFESKHNQNYWNKTHYLGVGPSAHSFNGVSRKWNIKNNIKYCEYVEKNKKYSASELLTRKNIINEYIMTNIRTRFGLDLSYLKKEMKVLEWSGFNTKILKLEKEKLITIGEKFHLTQKGMLFSDAISQKLFLI